MSTPAGRVCVCWLFKRVGDSLLATPAIRAIKRSFPDTRLTVVCERQTSRVFQFNPWIDRVLELPHPASLSQSRNALLNLGKPWAVVDFLSSPRTALSALLSGAQQRVGIALRGRRWAQTVSVPAQDRSHPQYSAVHKLKLALALGAAADGTATEFYIADADKAFAADLWRRFDWKESAPVAAFFIGSRRSYKIWPAIRYAEVIQWLLGQTQIVPLILQTPGDEVHVSALRRDLGASQVKVAEVNDLGALGAVLARCQILIGNDGGPKHLAVAVGTRTLTLFGDEPAAFWTPPDMDSHRFVQAAAGSVIASISSERVIRLAGAMLSSRTA